MTAQRICWDVSKADANTIVQIADRAVALYETYERRDVAMDITATHANGCPLRLSDLLGASEFDFLHDVGGIRLHLNRETGTLSRFHPRFAARP